MKREEIEKRLREEAEPIPDLSDEILAKAEEEGLFSTPAPAPTREKPFPNPIRRQRIARAVAAVAVAAAIFTMVVPGLLNQKEGVTASADTSVCMQINPAIEFSVNDGKVSAVRSLNQDAVVLLIHEKLVGAPIEEACLQVAQLADSRSLITTDGITVYVSGKNESEIEGKISGKLSTYSVRFGEENYQNEATRLATKYKITEGKARLAAKVLALYPNLAEEKVVKLRPSKLHELIEDYHEEEIERYEEELRLQYQALYGDFVQNVSALLAEYRTDLDALNGMTDTARKAEIPEFNQKYAQLGDDFWIETDESWRESYQECLEELEEIGEELEENADEVFADFFEDWLEEFQNEHFRDDD